ncbi:hypothetical protein CISG_03692 [Coccidioides immitis RMSCC 3703]|uniref:Uncharacterized protein n=2 Tax=Coccidioides immitis TaxID=5501 RepID=A0A0J8QQZ1_COCIT|nr:hypothetical protein CISG_03692 [Coccidioides immitis RMSCC 3703]
MPCYRPRDAQRVRHVSSRNGQSPPIEASSPSRVDFSRLQGQKSHKLSRPPLKVRMDTPTFGIAEAELPFSIKPCHTSPMAHCIKRKRLPFIPSSVSKDSPPSSVDSVPRHVFGASGKLILHFISFVVTTELSWRKLLERNRDVGPNARLALQKGRPVSILEALPAAFLEAFQAPKSNEAGLSGFLDGRRISNADGLVSAQASEID